MTARASHPNADRLGREIRHYLGASTDGPERLRVWDEAVRLARIQGAESVAAVLEALAIEFVQTWRTSS